MEGSWGMNKTKKILRSLVVVGVVGAVATAGAFSAFSGQTDNPNNQITAGTVDVQDNDSNGALYSIGNAYLEPSWVLRWISTAERKWKKPFCKTRFCWSNPMPALKNLPTWPVMT